MGSPGHEGAEYRPSPDTLPRPRGGTGTSVPVPVRRTSIAGALTPDYRLAVRAGTPCA